MFKSKIEGMIREELENKDIVIKTVIEQDLIWPGHTEVRAFASDGKEYSCLFEESDKIGVFVEVPSRKEVK